MKGFRVYNREKRSKADVRKLKHNLLSLHNVSLGPPTASTARRNHRLRANAPTELSLPGGAATAPGPTGSMSLLTMTTQPKILINSRSTSDDLRAFTGAISSCANTAAALRKVWNPANRQNADKDASAPPIFRRAMGTLRPMIGLEYGLADSPADADRAIEAAARAAGALIDVTIPALKAATVKDFFGALEDKLDYTQDAFIKPGFYMRAFNRDIDPAVDLTADTTGRCA